MKNNYDDFIIGGLFKILLEENKITKKEYKKITKEIQCTVN